MSQISSVSELLTIISVKHTSEETISYALCLTLSPPCLLILKTKGGFAF